MISYFKNAQPGSQEGLRKSAQPLVFKLDIVLRSTGSHMEFAYRGVVLFFLIALLAGCATPKIELGFEDGGPKLVGDNTYIGYRVREKAVKLWVALRMQGMKAKDIPVRIYLDNSPDKLVAELHWKPDSNASEWQWLPVFIPVSKLSIWSNGISIYAVSPDAPEGYYDRADTRVDLYKLHGGMTEGSWGLESFEEGVALEGDERGVQCAFWFETHGRQPHSFQASLKIMNPKNLESIRVPSSTTRFSVNKGTQVFEKIQFRVSYSDIARLLGVVRGNDLIFYPIAEWDDGRQSDNLYIDGMAFGTPQAVADDLQAVHNDIAREAENIEQNLKFLQQVGR